MGRYMIQIEVFVKPEYNDCCGCIDSQIWQNTRKDCRKCEQLKHGILHGFVREKKKTYGVVSYDNGFFDVVELGMIILKKGEN